MERRILMILMVLNFACVGSQEVKDPKDVSEIDLNDFGLNNDIIVTFNCNDGSIKVKEGTCCPENKPKICKDTCVEESCNCLEEYGFCVPKDYKHCGHGVTCPKDWECVAENETFVCLPYNVRSCGNGNWCQLNEECVKIDSESSCCSSEAAQICGNECCYNDYSCVDFEGGKRCVLPETAICNQQLICPEGFKCTPDNRDCILNHQEYCEGLNHPCDPGWHCTEHGCCPDGQFECGLACCPDGYLCDQGVCVLPGGSHCGQGLVCEPGTVCSGDRRFPCIVVGAEICGDQVCEPGTFCVEGHCCDFDSDESCGDFCCPRGYDCVETLDGLTCIMPGARICPDRRVICNPGEICASSEINGRNACMRVGWEDCGRGQHCNVNQVCVGNENGSRCCDRDKMTYCVGDCCFSGWQCIVDNQKYRHMCIPPGAEYCWNNNNLDWCPAGYFCGRIKCIPVGAQECEDGNYCSVGYQCTNQSGEIPCCPIGASVPCGDFCCALGSSCELVNGNKQCIPPGGSVCRNTLFGETVCYGGTFCQEDGYCLPDRLRDEKYNYCGCGYFCPENQACQGLCKPGCCEEKFEFDPACIGECLPRSTIISRQFEQVSDDLRMIINLEVIEWQGQRNISSCLNQCLPADWQCSQPARIGDGRDVYKCFFRVPKSQACLMGCMEPGKFCRDYLTSNSDNAYLSADERNIFPNQVEYRFGEWGELIDDFDIVFLGLAGVDVHFNPSGLCPNYIDGIYRSEMAVREDGSSSWLQPEAGREALEVVEAWIIDNLEGIDFPHGPYGQLYVLMFAEEDRDWNNITLDEIENKVIYGYDSYLLKGIFCSDCTWSVCERVLVFPVGCQCGAGGQFSDTEEEWVSNMSVKYSPGAYLYIWGNEDKIRIALKESDGHRESLADGREDDFSGFAVINKRETKRPQGKWIPLYKYESEEGGTIYWRVDQIAAFLLLRTVIVR